MQYIEAPEVWKRLPQQPGVFLSGGITGCPDWQSEITNSLASTNYMELLGYHHIVDTLNDLAHKIIRYETRLRIPHVFGAQN